MSRSLKKLVAEVVELELAGKRPIDSDEWVLAFSEIARAIVEEGFDRPIEKLADETALLLSQHWPTIQISNDAFLINALIRWHSN